MTRPAAGPGIMPHPAPATHRRHTLLRNAHIAHQINRTTRINRAIGGGAGRDGASRAAGDQRDPCVTPVTPPRHERGTPRSCNSPCERDRFTSCRRQLAPLAPIVTTKPEAASRLPAAASCGTSAVPGGPLAFLERGPGQDRDALARDAHLAAIGGQGAGEVSVPLVRKPALTRARGTGRSRRPDTPPRGIGCI
jgi:hypothetical protein